MVQNVPEINDYSCEKILQRELKQVKTEQKLEAPNAELSSHLISEQKGLPETLSIVRISYE